VYALRRIPYSERRRAAYEAAASESARALGATKKATVTAPGLRESFEFRGGHLVRFVREETDAARWRREVRD
jgi:hypothetical protein